MRRSDAQLVMAARAGDHHSFGELVHRYRKLVLSVAVDITSNPRQSEEIDQETFAVAWSRLGELADPRRFRNWICAIARLQSLGFLRARSVGPKARARTQGVARELPSPAPSPLDSIIDREEETALWRALGEVPEPYRRVLELHYREGRPVDAIARILAVSEASVKMRLHRGRRLIEREVGTLMGYRVDVRPPGDSPPE